MTYNVHYLHVMYCQPGEGKATCMNFGQGRICSKESIYVSKRNKTIECTNVWYF